MIKVEWVKAELISHGSFEDVKRAWETSRPADTDVDMTGQKPCAVLLYTSSGDRRMQYSYVSLTTAHGNDRVSVTSLLSAATDAIVASHRCDLSRI